MSGWWIALAACGAGDAVFGGASPAPAPAPAPDPAPVAVPTPAPAPVPAPAPQPWSGELAVCINEVMPDNQASLADETGAHPDWIELHNPTAAAVSLDGWTITDDQSEPDRHRLGPLEVPAGGWLVLYADGFPLLGPAHLSFSLSADGEEVGLYTPAGDGTVVVYGPMAGDVSLARVPDCCTGEGCWQYPFAGTPGATNVPAGATTPLLAAGSTWSYADGATVPGPGWFAPAFDDSAWPAGPAPLGYGDAPATEIGWGADPLARHETAWFRASFQVADPAAIDVLRLRVLRDDGAAVYLNGVAVFRSNLPALSGEDVLAVAPVESADEAVWHEAELSPDLLLAGANTLAVEVHQAAPDSDDLAFDLELLSAP